MRWKQFFTPVKSLNSKETHEFLRENEEETLLLDVRQPSEYEERHISGAKLIPLPLLGESLEELDKNKPIVVY